MIRNSLKDGVSLAGFTSLIGVTVDAVVFPITAISSMSFLFSAIHY
jgi:hypothetical protein